jgi:hypothetical protein
MDIKMNFGIDGQDLDSLLTPKNAGVYSFKVNGWSRRSLLMLQPECL